MNSIAIIDIEASGLHFDSYPIEIAVLKAGEVRSWLIKPDSKWTYWCAVAEKMHGITREQLVKEGLPVSIVAHELNRFMEGFEGVLYSDADRWDVDWVDTLYYSARQSRQFHIASIYDLLGGDARALFGNCKAELAASGRFTHHRAESDVKMIAEAFKLAQKR
ncbi:hypothetical protein [Microbulbifer variabilis]|uniref:3'-5' exonuclease n=1 Tax=Microbulbifer variabilis TaxID=266805 RepID=UPI001CFD35BA|nr:hypothetical protein [Microbulbifer variabilis]